MKCPIRKASKALLTGETYVGADNLVRPESLAQADCGGLLPIIPERENERCLIDDASADWLDRRTVRALSDKWAKAFEAPRKSLVVIFASNDVSTVFALLGAASAGHAAMLVDPTSSPVVQQRLFDLYSPDFLVQPAASTWSPNMDYTTTLSNEDSVVRWFGGRTGEDNPVIYPDLQLLLSTSGTTGSSKFVRLSQRAINANAWQIVKALEITSKDVAIGHLPPHYSYGLSVITSHLAIGGAVALINGGVTDTTLWKRVDALGGTHFPGVPFHYGVLARFGIEATVPKSVTCFTQAGGALELRFQRSIHEQVQSRGGRFYVMYGQTEAAPRMTTLPNERFEQKTGSVGKALDGSRVVIAAPDGKVAGPGQSGSVIYYGPNVMLGYAEQRSDLSKADELHQKLETGDVGKVDHEGFLYLEGRTKRFAKLFGLRVGLDELELRLAELCDVAAFDLTSKILLIHGPVANGSLNAAMTSLALEYKIPRSSFVAYAVEVLPRLSSGKIDYANARRLYEF